MRCRACAGAQHGVDGQAGGRAEAVQQQVAGVSQARDEPQAEEIEEREHDFGGAVGVGRVLGDRQLGVQDRLERVDRFAFGDGHDLGAVLAVLVADPVDEVQRAAPEAELAGHRVGGGGAAAGRGALPVGA